MNKLSKIIIMASTFCLITGCSMFSGDANTNKNVKMTCTKQYAHTIPDSVLLIENKKIPLPYEVIGNIEIKNYNMVGIKRQQAVINDLLQENAAQVGGNAIIGIKKTNTLTSGEVIRFTS